MDIEIISQSPAGQAHPVPVLLIHGGYHGAWCWEHNYLPTFAAAGYKTYAMSQRGRAGSRGAVRFLGTEDFVADMEQVARQVEVETGRHPVLLGHSIGGYFVQKYLERHHAPAAVLLASVPVRGMLPFLLRYAVSRPFLFLAVNITLDTGHLIATPERVREMFFSPDVPEELLSEVCGKLERDSYRIMFDSALFKLPKPELVGTPMLVLGAENDAFFPPSEIQATAAAYNTEAVLFAGMAHDMMLERNWRLPAVTILDWLQKVL